MYRINQIKSNNIYFRQLGPYQLGLRMKKNNNNKMSFKKVILIAIKHTTYKVKNSFLKNETNTHTDTYMHTQVYTISERINHDMHMWMQNV